MQQLTITAFLKFIKTCLSFSKHLLHAWFLFFHPSWYSALLFVHCTVPVPIKLVPAYVNTLSFPIISANIYYYFFSIWHQNMLSLGLNSFWNTPVTTKRQQNWKLTERQTENWRFWGYKNLCSVYTFFLEKYIWITQYINKK
jgi:hypothetical protein